MNIYDQLQAVEDRYEELGELLSDPEVVSDTKRFMELSREEANTRETVTVYREHKVGALRSWKHHIMVSEVSKKWLPWFQDNQSTLNSNMNRERTVYNVSL